MEEREKAVAERFKITAMMQRAKEKFKWSIDEPKNRKMPLSTEREW